MDQPRDRIDAGDVEPFAGRTCFSAFTRSAEYNKTMGETFDEVRDFVVLHYLLSHSDAGEFWREARSIEPPDRLAHAISLDEESGLVNTGQQDPFG